MTSIPRSILILAVVVVAFAVPSIAADELLTLENIFDRELFESKVPRRFLWLPDGSAFVYRAQRDAVDGLWRHEAATGEVSLVADWAAVMATLRRGRPDVVPPAMGDINTHAGAGRRPTVSPDGTLYLDVINNDLFTVDLRDGGVRYLTDGPALERFAAFSPNGKSVAFARDGDLFVIEVSTRREHRLTDRGGDHRLLNGVTDWVYEEELEVERSFWWSPDGDSIAYVQYDTSRIEPFPIVDHLEATAVVEWQMYPKAGEANSEVRLGVISAAGDETRWIPTGVGDGYIARVGWLPSGRQLWFQILNRAQNRLELRIAEPGSGSSRLVLAEESEAWVNVRDDLVFVDEERFIWSSERGGWRHLYLQSVDGSPLARLTDGEWQVEKVYGFDAARERVLFQANAEDPRERHLYSVALGGGQSKLLVSSAGTHRADLAPGGRHFLDRFSSLTTPDRVDLYEASGRHIRVVDNGAIPALAELEPAAPELGTVVADDGETLYTSMFLPPGLDPGKRYPVLVYVYGGPHSQLVTNAWGGSRHLYYRYLARKGLIVFTLDNRGTWGRGHAFESKIYRRLGAWELADQVTGVRHLKQLPFVDPERIGVYGGSYGGYMALMCMNKAPEHFKVGIAYAPVADWRLYDTIYTERYMGLPADNPEGYLDSAPLNFADGLDGDLLICHGTMDNNVHLQNTIQMLEAYTVAGRQVELMVYPRVRHGVRVSHHRLHFHRLKTDFLERHLIMAERPVTDTP